MKKFATLLSLYALSLNFLPAGEMLVMRLLSHCCQQGCSDDPVSRKTEKECEKECCFMACCCKIQFLNATYKEINFFPPILKIKHQFSYQNGFLPIRIFDIWHPPRST